MLAIQILALVGEMVEQHTGTFEGLGQDHYEITFFVDDQGCYMAEQFDAIDGLLQEGEFVEGDDCGTEIYDVDGILFEVTEQNWVYSFGL